MVPARAARDGEHLRDDVEIERGENRGLLVAAMHVLTECRIVVPYAGIDGGRAGQRPDIGDAGRPACEGDREIRGLHDGIVL